jgi:Spy/CpxP family protein refolding chaperone
MKLSLGRQVTGIATVALAGALTLGAGGVALAQQAAPPPQSDTGPHQHRHHEGIVAQALALPSLTAAQRTAIERLEETRRAAEVPVKQADARLLTALATQVEQAAIDRQALAPDLQARDGAAAAAHAVDQQTLQQLHDLLTPAQRSALVDAVEATGHGGDGHDRREHLAHMEERLGLSEQQEAQIASNLRAEHQGAPDGGHHGGAGAWRQAWLESFRTDSFNATANGAQHGGGHRGDHLENLMQAMLPVLSPTQRAQLATQLRHRAAHESRT